MLRLALSLTALLLAAAPVTAAPTAVRVDDDFFKPGRVKIDRGDKVVWKWKGSDVHNVALWKPGRSIKREPNKRSGVKTRGKFRHKFRRVGTWRAICEIHPNSMRMKVVVKRL